MTPEIEKQLEAQYERFVQAVAEAVKPEIMRLCDARNLDVESAYFDRVYKRGTDVEVSDAEAKDVLDWIWWSGRNYGFDLPDFSYKNGVWAGI